MLPSEPSDASRTSHGTAVRTGARAVAIVGNPNSGKSTLFNAMTGGNQPVGNWAGVTVDREVGHIQQRGVDMAIVDLPGVYSLAPSTVDEAVTRDHVLDGSAELFVNVVDGSNLERNLYLTVQLLEMGVPVIIALNMLDTASEHGVDIDPRALAEQLGCPVIPISASKRHGLEQLRDAMVDRLTYRPETVHPLPVDYPDELGVAVVDLAERLVVDPRHGVSARWTATRLLEGDPFIEARVPGDLASHAAALREQIEEETDEDVDILVADARYQRIGDIAAAVLRRRDRLSATRSEKIDRIALHPRLGIPVFLTVMYVMFMLTINVGSAFIDLFDALGGALFVQLPSNVLAAVGMPDFVVGVVAGIGGGLQTVVTFIPPVGIMFLCLRFLEDSGYMARAAFVTDRLMRALGLPGKAFVPMIVGFGCNVPAIMGARTLESERDRKLAVAMNPFMSCGARLPVYALFAAAFFPQTGQIVVFALYLIGIAFAVLTGLVLKRTLLVGDLSPFIMELPPYHRPSAKAVIKGAWQRLRTFVIGAGRFIVPVVAVLTLLGSIGTDGTFGNENTDRSVLSSIGRTLTPVFEPMGIHEDNWPATVGIFTGIFAKEVVVGSLDSLYQQLGREDAAAAGAAEPDAGPVEAVDEPGVVENVVGGFTALPAAIVDSLRSAADPLGISVGPVDTVEHAADAQEVDQGTFGAMASRFDGGIGAFAYLLFILLYLPCVAATAAIYRETGLGWAMFVGAWTTGLAWGAATGFYQAATFAQHPGSSAAWIAFIVVAFIGVVVWMGRGGAREPVAVAAAAPVTVATRLPAMTNAERGLEPQVEMAPAGAAPLQASNDEHARGHGHTRASTLSASPFVRIAARPFAWQGPSAVAPSTRPVAPAEPVQPAQPVAQPFVPTAARPAPIRRPDAVRIDSRPTPFATARLGLSGRPDTEGGNVVKSPSHSVEDAPA